MNSDSKRENSRHRITTSGMTRTISPIGPGTQSIGAKAATVVSTPKITGTDDARGAADRPEQRFAAARAARVGVLADHDGVVHHDAEHDDERHQRDQVDGEVQARHQGQRAEKRERDAEAHPEREPQAQEQRQDQQHQHEAAPPGAQQRVDPIAQEARIVLRDGQGDSLRELAFACVPGTRSPRAEMSRALCSPTR